MARWTRDYATGEVICAVCGAERNGRSKCCKTAPFVDFDTFAKIYFEGETQNYQVAREFWDDYLTSDYPSIKAYAKATTSY